MLKYVLSQNLVIFHSLFQILGTNFFLMGIQSLLYLYSVTNIPSMPCARKASKWAKLQCREFLSARASMHSRQPLQSRNRNHTVVLNLLLKLSSLWKLRWLLQRFQSTFRAPPHALEARFHLFRNLFQILKMQKII